MQEHKKNCLKINRQKSVKLRSGSIRFNNYFKQLAVPFRIYDDFEFVLKRIHSDDIDNNDSYPKKHKAHIISSFSYNAVCIDDKFSKPVVP